MIIVYGSRQKRKGNRKGRGRERGSATCPSKWLFYDPVLASHTASLLGIRRRHDQTRPDKTRPFAWPWFQCSPSLSTEIEQTLIRGSRAVAPLYQLLSMPSAPWTNTNWAQGADMTSQAKQPSPHLTQPKPPPCERHNQAKFLWIIMEVCRYCSINISKPMVALETSLCSCSLRQRQQPLLATLRCTACGAQYHKQRQIQIQIQIHRETDIPTGCVCCTCATIYQSVSSQAQWS